MSKQWFGEWGGVFYLLRDRDENFKKGDSFFERAGRYGPIIWDGKEILNYHCKKIICTFKKNTKMSKEECKYDVCWHGQCKEATINDSDFCEEHLNKTCVCGNQANGDCHKHAGSFICGAPLCDKCRANHHH